MLAPIRFLAALCPPLVVAAAIFGSDMIGVVYGAKFVPAEPVVVILLVPYLLLPMAGLSDALLWTFGRGRDQFATRFQTEIDRVIHCAGDPGVVGHPGHGGEAHAGDFLDHAQDDRNRLDTGDGLNVSQKG